MMYRARVEAINGLNVKAGGKWLIAIGNKPVSIGEIVWTDGRCVYGNYQYHAQPFVPTFDEDIFFVLLLQNNRYFSSLRQSDSFRNVHQDLQFSYASDNKLSDRYFFSVGRKNFLLILGEDKRIRFPEPHTYKADAVITNDESVLQVLEQYESASDKQITIYKDGNYYADFSSVIRSFFSGYPNYEDEEEFDSWFSVERIEAACVDLEGNFYGVACCKLKKEISPPDPALTWWGEFDGYSADDSLIYLLLKNDSYTLLYHVTVRFLIHDGNHMTKTNETLEQDFKPYSIVLPLKNQGKGGFFSLDYSFFEPNSEFYYHTDSNDFSIHDRNFLTAYRKAFLGVIFFDADGNKLFSISREDIADLKEITLPSYDELKNSATSEEIFRFDICKIKANDYLILFAYDSYSLLYGRREYDLPYTTTAKHILRYTNGRLTYVTDAVDQMFALVRIPKKKYNSVIKTFADGIAKNLETIIF